METTDGTTGYEYIFGFGSIINTSTHGPWLTSSSSASSSLPGIKGTPFAVAVVAGTTRFRLSNS